MSDSIKYGERLMYLTLILCGIIILSFTVYGVVFEFEGIS